MSAEEPGGDESAVRQALSDLHDALDRRDVEAIRALCRDDVVFFGSAEGEEATDRDQIAAMLTTLAPATAGSGFALEWTSVGVDVEGDVAFLTAIGTATFTSSRGAESSRYRLTGALVRDGDRWLWRCHHGSEPAAL